MLTLAALTAQIYWMSLALEFQNLVADRQLTFDRIADAPRSVR
jgi:hypothetical protein